jgi:hypothetical protein
MDSGKTRKTAIREIAIYAVIAIIMAAGYLYAVGLMAIQTPWVDVVMGKVSANTILALILWTIIIEKIGKKRKWSSRKVWGFMMIGVLLLVIIVQLTPIR